MDVDYIRLLMLYSDIKYPFVKAKADPGLSEGLRSTGKFLRENGSRKMDRGEANQIMLLERHAQQNATQQRFKKTDNNFLDRDAE